MDFMKRNRAVVILIKGDEVLLMFRCKKGNEYYVFPGGGVEIGETNEQATLRELKEESTIEAKIKKLLYQHIYDDGTEQFFYLCDYISGEPKLDKDCPEKKKMVLGKEFYNPLWVKISELKNMLVYPLEIRDLLMKDYKNKFTGPINIVNIKIRDLRRNL
jgi:mutator protein MutT